MLPGLGKMQKQMAAANIDDKILLRQEAIINSMTPKERTRPKLDERIAQEKNCRGRRCYGSGSQ